MAPTLFFGRQIPKNDTIKTTSLRELPKPVDEPTDSDTEGSSGHTSSTSSVTSQDSSLDTYEHHTPKDSSQEIESLQKKLSLIKSAMQTSLGSLDPEEDGSLESLCRLYERKIEALRAVPNLDPGVDTEECHLIDVYKKIGSRVRELQRLNLLMAFWNVFHLSSYLLKMYTSVVKKMMSLEEFYTMLGEDWQYNEVLKDDVDPDTLYDLTKTTLNSLRDTLVDFREAWRLCENKQSDMSPKLREFIESQVYPAYNSHVLKESTEHQRAQDVILKYMEPDGDFKQTSDMFQHQGLKATMSHINSNINIAESALQGAEIVQKCDEPVLEKCRNWRKILTDLHGYVEDSEKV